MTISRFGGIAIVVGVILLSGCAATAVVVGTTAMASGASREAKIGDRSIQSLYPDLRGVSYAIYPFNWVAVSQPEHFIIAVDFWRRNTKEPFGEIEVDLSQIVLWLEDGSTYRPTAYGLTYLDHVSQGCRDTGYAPPRLMRTRKEDYKPLPPTAIKLRSPGSKSFKSECVNLVFLTPTPSPGSLFEIEIAGVRYMDTVLPSSRVSFNKGYGYD